MTFCVNMTPKDMVRSEKAGICNGVPSTAVRRLTQPLRYDLCIILFQKVYVECIK